MDKQELLRRPSKPGKSYLPDGKLKHSPANYLFSTFNTWSVSLNIRVEILKQTDIHFSLLHATNSLVFHHSPANHQWCNSQSIAGLPAFLRNLLPPPSGYLLINWNGATGSPKQPLLIYYSAIIWYLYSPTWQKHRLSYPMCVDNGNSAPRFLNLNARSRGAVVFALRTLYLLEMSHY
jgi:hypothetical protein